jgi:hypothetical protein
MNFLEMNRRMPGITQPKTIDLPGLRPDIIGKFPISLPEIPGCVGDHRMSSRGTVFPVLNSSRAASAIRASLSCDPAKASSQLLSSSSSMSNLAAMASWLSGGSFETASMAFWSSSVMGFPSRARCTQKPYPRCKAKSTSVMSRTKAGKEVALDDTWMGVRLSPLYSGFTGMSPIGH